MDEHDDSPGDGAPQAVDFERFYREHYRRLVVSLRLADGGYAGGGAGGAGAGSGPADDAEDLAQDAFARTLVRWAGVRTGTNPAGYVYRVAFRLQRRGLRRRWHRRTAMSLVRTRAQRRHEAQPSSPGDLWAEAADVRAALAELPVGCRRVAALCLYAEMTPGEAAVVLGIRPSTVRTQLQRARSTLRSATGHEDEAEAEDNDAGDGDEPDPPSSLPGVRSGGASDDGDRGEARVGID